MTATEARRSRTFRPNRIVQAEPTREGFNPARFFATLSRRVCIQQRLSFTSPYSNRDAFVRIHDWDVASLPEFEGATSVSHRLSWDQSLSKLVFR